MEQQQSVEPQTRALGPTDGEADLADSYKVSLSVGTKLLISAVTLLFIVILFLNISTIVLVTEDRRAYTYQSQSTEAVLAGREITTMGRQALDALRVSLASINPEQPLTPKDIAGVQSQLDNQSQLFALELQLVDLKTVTPTLLTRHLVDKLGHAAAVSSWDDLGIDPDLMHLLMIHLMKDGYSFFSLPKAGQSPILGVALADLGTASSTAVPVALGFLSLKDLSGDLRTSHLTISDLEGWVLFDNDPAFIFGTKNIAGDPLFEAAKLSQVAAGAREFESSGSRFLGSFVRPGMNLVVLSKTEWRKAMRATYALTERYILLGLMATAAAVISALLFSKTMTAPLKRLYDATRLVAAGNFNIRLDEGARDEIGALSRSFVAMSRKIGTLIQERVRRVQLENELAIASAVQQTLIPPPTLEFKNISIHSHYQSATECGGDWWGHFEVGNKMCLMIADATGHGLPSALITAAARSCFSVVNKLANERADFLLSPASLLSYANRVVHDSASGKIHMTFFVAVIDFDEMTLTYSCAGHNPPWLFSKDGDVYHLTSLVATGPRLGEKPDAKVFEEMKVKLKADDVLFLYTDGLLEARDESGVLYGKKRAKQMIDASIAQGPQAVIRAVLEDFLEFNGNRPLEDDVTMAVARILSPNET